MFLSMFFFSSISIPMELPIKVDMDKIKSNELPEPYPLTRERICLNGIWDFYPIIDKSPKHGPILEKIPPLPVEKEWKKFQVPAKWRKIVPELAAVEFDFPKEWVKANRAWYRRDFTIPESMRRKRIKLKFNGVLVYTKVFVNDKSVGKHFCGVTPFEFDITHLIKFGQQNVLRMYVVNSDIHYIKKPVSRYKFTSRAPIYYSYSQGSAGIWQDVYLVSEPKVTVENVQIITSTRKKQITAKITISNYLDKPLRLLVAPSVTKLTGDPVKSLEAQDITVPAKSYKLVIFNRSWTKPKLWSPEEPNLYYLNTKILKDGTLVDENFQRFGFREFWINGKDFILNGHQIRLKGDWIGLTGASPDAHLRPEHLKLYFKIFKDANYAGTRIKGIDQTETALNICDEIGLPIIATGISDGPRFFDPAYTQEAMEHSVEDVRDWIKRDRNHPSILIWSTENEDNAPYKKNVFDRYVALDRTIIELDSTRPFMHDGDKYGGGDFHGWAPIKNFHYPGRTISLERQIYQFSEWNKNGKKPLILGEALLCGDEFTKFGGLFRQIGDKVWGELDHRYMEFDRIIKITTGGWRSYGLSGIMLHDNKTAILNAPLPAHLSGDEKRILQFEWKNYETPFAKPKYLLRSNLYFYNPWIDSIPSVIKTPMFETIKQAFAPKLVTLARSTDHNFWAGDEVTKNAYVINDSSDEIIGAYLKWRLSEYDGKEIISNKISLDIAQGDIKPFLIKFRMPRSQERELFKLEVYLVSSDGETISSNTQEITAYPHLSKLPQIKKPVFLYDKIGKTANLFKQQGISYQLIGLNDLSRLSPNGSVLIIGCNSMDKELIKISRLISSFTQKGGRLLAFEQETMHKCSRSFAFIRAPKHPIFNGLPPDRLKLWRTKHKEISGSTLGSDMGLNQKALIEVVSNDRDDIFSDFSPVVVETQPEKGRMVVCNLHITDACEQGEPEALIMLRNMLEYISQPVLANIRYIRYIGNKETKQFFSKIVGESNLKETLFENWNDIQNEDSVLILDNSNKDSNLVLNKKKISSFANQGGTVLYAGGYRFNGFHWLPISIDTRELPIKIKSPGKTSFGAFHLWKRSDDPILDGLGDLYVLESKRAKQYYIGDQIEGLIHGFLKPQAPWETGFEIATTETCSYKGLRRRPYYGTSGDAALIFMKHGKGMYILSLIPTKPTKLSTKLYSTILSNIGVSCKNYEPLSIFN